MPLSDKYIRPLMTPAGLYRRAYPVGTSLLFGPILLVGLWIANGFTSCNRC
jgi:hypothetical protein